MGVVRPDATVDAAHPLPDLADDVEKLAGPARGDPALDAWFPRERPFALSAQPDVAAELYRPASALSAEQSFAARAAAVGRLRPEALQDAVSMPALVALLKPWPKVRRGAQLRQVAGAVLMDAVAPQLAAQARLPVSQPAAQPQTVARRARAESVRLQELKEQVAAVLALRAPEAQPLA